MKIINLQSILFVLFIIILLERLYELLIIKRNKTVRSYNKSTTYFLTITYIVLATIIGAHIVSAKGINFYFLTLGLLVYFISTVLRRKAIKTLGEYFELNVAFAQDHKLFTSGIYSIMRHPYYCGALLEVIALPIAFNALEGLFFCLLVNVPLWIYRITIEERALVDFFGDQYLQYCRVVPLIFPGKVFIQKTNCFIQNKN
jgi:protein-S-isoprenylcysteine O-methyltransferase Ste14